MQRWKRDQFKKSNVGGIRDCLFKANLYARPNFHLRLPNGQMGYSREYQIRGVLKVNDPSQVDKKLIQKKSLKPVFHL